MARKAQTAGVLAPSGTLGRAAFKKHLDDLLKRMEAAKPLTAARELEHRIADGTSKIEKAAEKLGEADPRIVAARAQLATLRTELDTLRRDYLVPHHALHWIHYLLDNAERGEWPLTETGKVRVSLPGIIDVEVEIPTQVPF